MVFKVKRKFCTVNRLVHILNELPQVKFRLLLTLPDREPYEVEYKDVVSMLDIGAITVGAKLPVYVDLNDERNILLMYS
jgi:hypothetical protein